MSDTTTKEEWEREYDIAQKRACDAEAESARLREALERLADTKNWYYDGWNWCWDGLDENEAHEVAQHALKESHE